MSRRKPKLLKCKVVNSFSAENQEDYDRKVYKTLAEALYRNLDAKEFNFLIEKLGQV